MATLTAKEKEALKKVRDGLPELTPDTVMQKVIPVGDIQHYLSGKYTALRGFITRFEDVPHLTTYDDIYNGLRLEYPGSEFVPDVDDCMGVIRFKTKETSKIFTPYKEEMGGSSIGAPPFTGNGFTSAENGRIIPEFKCHADGRLKVLDGAQLIEIGRDGTEKILGIYSEGDKKFISIE